MELCGELRLPVVAAAVEDGDGDAVFDHRAQQHLVAALDFLERKVHLAEAIVAVVVRTGNPDHEIRGEFVERVGECFEKLLEIHLALHVANRLYIEARGDLFSRVVFADVDGVGENARVVAEYGGGSVALVGVGVDDHDLDVRLFVLEISDRDGDVVENAVALSVPAEGMVGAAGKADANALGECCVAGEAGGLHLGGGARE